MPISDAELDNLFTYHPPIDDQVERYARLRTAAKTFATAIRDLTPSSADQTAAVRKVREAVFTANAAIACSPLESLPPLPAA